MYTPTVTRIGVQPIAFSNLAAPAGSQSGQSPFAGQEHPLGSIIPASDPVYGEGEFIYLLGVANTVVGSLVTWADRPGLSPARSRLSRRPWRRPPPISGSRSRSRCQSISRDSTAGIRSAAMPSWRRTAPSPRRRTPISRARANSPPRRRTAGQLRWPWVNKPDSLQAIF